MNHRTQGHDLDTAQDKRVRANKRHIVESVWRVVRTFLLFAGALLLVVGLGLSVYARVESLFRPPQKAGALPVQIHIARGTSVRGIGSLLEEEGIIQSATAFKLYMDFTGVGSTLKAGTYWLDDTMTFQQITEKLSRGDGGRSIAKVLVTEGATVQQIAQSLVESGLFASDERFLALCKEGNETLLSAYPFLNEIAQQEDADKRYYLLEGYLFPATYEVYTDISEEELLCKMLDKFAMVMNETFISRAEELQMSVDEVITLASLVEREAKQKDFPKVSAVFHNRLQKEMTLGSDVTIQYIKGTSSLILSDTDISVDSPYNTYKYKGLPLGPVANPGLKAIEAALYPNETYQAEGYYYFILKDPATGELEYNKTLSAHEEAKRKYQPLWKAYEAAQHNAQE